MLGGVTTGLMGWSLFGWGKEEEKEEDEIIVLIKQAMLAEQRGKEGDAEDFYHKALQMAKDRRLAEVMTDAEWVDARNHIYDGMANLSFRRGHHKKAEKLFKELLKGLMEKGIKNDDNAVVEISLKLAMIYVMTKNRDAAEAGYNFCIKTQEEKIKELKEVDYDTTALLGICLDSYARFLMLENRLDEARHQFEVGLETAVKVFGWDHAQTLVILNDLATVTMMTKRYAEAEKHLKKGVDIAKKIGAPELTALLCNLGALYIAQNETKKANSCCTSALKNAEKTKDKVGEHHAGECLKKLIEISEKQKQKETPAK